METCFDSWLLEQIARIEQCHCDVLISSLVISHDQWYEHFMMTSIWIVFISLRSSDASCMLLCPDLDLLAQFSLTLLGFEQC